MFHEHLCNTKRFIVHIQCDNAILLLFIISMYSVIVILEYSSTEFINLLDFREKKTSLEGNNLTMHLHNLFTLCF